MSSAQPANSRSLEAVPAIVMCGGQGTGLHSLTKDLIPKALLPVGDRTLLEHTLGALHRDGIRRAVLAVAHHADQIRRFIGAERCGLEISYYQTEGPTGMLQDLVGACAQAGFRGDVLLTGCDELCDGLGLDAVHAFHVSSGAAATLLVASGVPVVDRHFDAIVDDDHRVQSLARPAALDDRLSVLGISLLSPEVVDLARALTPAADLADRGVLIWRLLPSLIQEGRVAGYRCRPRAYFHVTTPDAYARATAWLRQPAPMSGVADGAGTASPSINIQ